MTTDDAFKNLEEFCDAHNVGYTLSCKPCIHGRPYRHLWLCGVCVIVPDQGNLAACIEAVIDGATKRIEKTTCD